MSILKILSFFNKRNLPNPRERLENFLDEVQEIFCQSTTVGRRAMVALHDRKDGMTSKASHS